MLDDDSILTKYKLGGMTDERISQKLGISTQEVALRWGRIVEAAKNNFAGQVDFGKQLNVLALQYQLLGESLKIIANALSNAVSPTELRTMVTNDPEETVRNLTQSAIVLKPFVMVDPIAALEAHQKKN